MLEKFKALFKGDSRDQPTMNNVQRVYNLYMSGIITKDNAINNLWDNYLRVRGDSNKISIANKLKHIERGW